jgi:TetR/AcrR family tetracycline transcriptional repressor
MSERQGAPRRRRLSRERVVAAALQIVDRDGLDGLTMRALGRELGVDPMAVYHWVPSKDDLLDLIVEAVFREMPLDPNLLPKGDWKERYFHAAKTYRDALRRHPHALPVLATRPPLSLTAMRVVEFAMRILRDAGFPPATALGAVNAMAWFVIGFVLAEVGLPPGAESDVGEEDQAALLRTMTREEFPNVLEALDEYGQSWDLQFAFGMKALIRGLDQARA